MHTLHSSHYSYYLRDGMSVLEFGAAENSYLPGWDQAWAARWSRAILGPDGAEPGDY